MGLAEKRLAESIKTGSLPALESKLNDLAGYPIKVAVDWNTFTAYDTYPLVVWISFSATLNHLLKRSVPTKWVRKR